MPNNPNFSKYLISWYLEHKRDLPWRETTNPYFIWLSEIMLQQTQVSQGLPYYLKFTTQYPTVFDLAKASEDEVLKMWQGLGYYSRARNLHATARYVAHELNGVFPKSHKDLLKLKGVGDYTASAIASICYNEPVAVVDGNVYRVLSRYFGIDTPINSTQGIKEFKALAEMLLDKNEPALFNQAIMEFGARHCKPKNPLCESCPFNDSCIALKGDHITQLPVKLKAAKVKKRHLNYLVFVTASGFTQLYKRTGKGIWEGLYEFPFIETERELKEKSFSKTLEDSAFNVSTEEFIQFNEKPIIHKLSHQHLHTKFWIVQVKQIENEAVPISSLQDFPVPVLIENFLQAYRF